MNSVFEGVPPLSHRALRAPGYAAAVGAGPAGPAGVGNGVAPSPGPDFPGPLAPTHPGSGLRPGGQGQMSSQI